MAASVELSGAVTKMVIKARAPTAAELPRIVLTGKVTRVATQTLIAPGKPHVSVYLGAGQTSSGIAISGDVTVDVGPMPVPLVAVGAAAKGAALLTGAIANLETAIANQDKRPVARLAVDHKGEDASRKRKAEEDGRGPAKRQKTK